MKRFSAIIAAIAVGCSLSAADFQVATNGSPLGTGSATAPWDLPTALAHPATVRPGDTIWLQGGTYTGAFRSVLSGSAERPVTVRQAPGQRAIIDSGALFDLSGSNVVWWGFEVTCSHTQRVTTLPGSWPQDINRGGIQCRGAQMKFVNLVVHDTSGGFGFWSAGAGGEISGCLIYYNGWRGPDRGHGHGIYAQNRSGTKRIADNIVFANFGYGIHCYGSAKAFLSGFDLAGNVSFNNGALSAAGERAPNLFVGGGCVAERIRVWDNFTYGGGCSLRLGYPWGPVNADAVVSNNYLCGERIHLLQWETLTFTNNTVISSNELALVESPATNWQWDATTYLRVGTQWAPFHVVRDKKVTGCSFAQWQQATGLDRRSSYREGQPSGLRVFVRPNRYEPGRAHIIVYNWDQQPAVPVNLDSVLAVGQRYRIFNAQNFHGPPVCAGTCDGKPIRLSMAPGPLAPPVGMAVERLPVTQPEFGVFVLVAVE